MIVGTGIDIAEVPRIREAITRFGDRFLQRIFSAGEIRYCDPKANRVKRYPARLALTSFPALRLELGLTGLFSVVLFYHFAFLAISIALLGLGAGGVSAYLLKSRLARIGTRALAATLCMVNSVVVVLVLEIVL